MSRMPIINFDEQFESFVSEWVTVHRSEYDTFDALEADLPRVYMLFLNTRAKWLGNLTPGSYFTQFEDPKVLVDWMHEYCRQRVPVPDLLTEQITFVGRPCEKRLLELMKDPEAEEEAVQLAIGLLREMESTLPRTLYIQWQLNWAEKDDRADNALDSLKAMGKSVVQPILQEIDHANEAGQEALLDVLTDYPGDEKTFRIAMKHFENRPKRRALMAGYLAKIGDDRALPALEKAAKEPSLSYLTYIELRSAIERLGGECPEREYDGDEEYEALRDMGMT